MKHQHSQLPLSLGLRRVLVRSCKESRTSISDFRNHQSTQANYKMFPSYYAIKSPFNPGPVPIPTPNVPRTCPAHPPPHELPPPHHACITSHHFHAPHPIPPCTTVNSPVPTPTNQTKLTRKSAIMPSPNPRFPSTATALFQGPHALDPTPLSQSQHARHQIPWIALMQDELFKVACNAP
jgi:hypothetical protein